MASSVEKRVLVEMQAEIDRLRVRVAELEQSQQWQPIDSCPSYKMVLLLCAELSPWARTVWKGRKIGGDDPRNYGYDTQYEIATPYGIYEDGFHKQVWCPIERGNASKQPTHWMPLPAIDAAMAKDGA